jgi:hypothetical protein
MSTIAELMAKDPLECSQQDIEEIVKDFRSKRHLFGVGDQKAGSTKKITSAVKLKLSL